ncbi:UbiA family prenyltransferase [archaeon]|jgi:4-hydroxybenzoate polyprenyltransferase|nr:UbiA family prenyltransferase [archaeon]MBT4022811.1 UbiA family prenyltransferase [archaeon]MBT4272995.1 UbiA family prenyltransferase [archaeon]MBT4460914.1 UbiA family prenyltransferase [archaeon]MBT4858130.1 UbiA family prenyltransferase [archaeon]
MNKRIKYLLLLFKVSRPVLWIVGPLIFISGIIVSNSTISVLAFIQLILMSFPLSLVTFGINDIHDYKTDLINPRKKIIEGIILSPKYHKFVLKYVYLFSLLIILVSFFSKNLMNIISTILVVFFAHMYSTQPIRFKELPPFDSISNGLLVFFSFLIGFSYNSSFSQLTPQIYGATICIIGFHSYTTIMDYSADKKSKTKTFAVVYGKRVSALFSLLLTLFTQIFINYSLIVSNFLNLCILIYLISVFYPNEKLSKTLVKVIYLTGIVVSLIWIGIFK